MAQVLAQVNVAFLAAPPADHRMRGFAAAFDAVAAAAEDAPGFVWRLRTDPVQGEPVPAGHPVVWVDTDDGPMPMAVNVSVWQDYRYLHRFTYHGVHGRLLLQRRRWFAPTPQPSTALWWIDPGAYPSIDQALVRLGHLRRHGPDPRAFSLLMQFDPTGRRIRPVHPRADRRDS